MPIPCTPQDLVTGASCYYCKVPDLESIEIALLCAMAGGTPFPPSYPCDVLLGEDGEPILDENGNYICLEQSAPQLTIGNAGPSPDLSWTQGSEPTTNAIWRSQNGAAFALLATQAGALTTYNDPSSMSSGDYWSYKIVPSEGSESAPADVSNAKVLPGAGAVYFPNLVVEFQYLSFAGYATLTSVSLPRLKRVGDVAYLDAMLAMNTLSVPLLESVVGNLQLAGNIFLPVISMPSLVSVGGSILCSGNPLLTSVSMPALQSVAFILDISGNVALTSINLPSLVSVLFPFYLPGNTALVTLSLPALNTPGDVDWSGCTSLTTISIPSQVFLNMTLWDIRGCALSASTVNHILARAAASGTTNLNLKLEGGTSAAPTGQGIVDKAALITAGNTITTN